MNALFDQAQAQSNRDRAALPPASLRAALPHLLRNSLAWLLLAVAFRRFARRSWSRHPLPVEGKRPLQRLTGGQAGMGLRADASR